MINRVGGGADPTSELGFFLVREVRSPEVLIVLYRLEEEGAKYLLSLRGGPDKVWIPQWIADRQEALNEFDRQVHNHSRHIHVTVREDS